MSVEKIVLGLIIIVLGVIIIIKSPARIAGIFLCLVGLALIIYNKSDEQIERRGDKK